MAIDEKIGMFSCVITHLFPNIGDSLVKPTCRLFNTTAHALVKQAWRVWVNKVRDSPRTEGIKQLRQPSVHVIWDVVHVALFLISWWRHQMEAFSA